MQNIEVQSVVLKRFAPEAPQAPYLYRLAASLGVKVMVKSALTGVVSPFDRKAPVNYKDEYSVAREDEARLANIKSSIERNTKFVYFGNYSFRVNKEALRTDILTIDNEFYFEVGPKDILKQISEDEVDMNAEIYPILEIYDVEHQFAVAASL